jgi:4-diphosphocytidyl-2-C-methyl-D-erythritol kinase
MITRTFRSFAKINLGLEVVGKLPSGYHELKTLFATVSLHDLIEIKETRKGVVVRTDHPAVPGDETNIAHRAAMLMLAMSGRKAGVDITIHKRIPVGGGLGGGSSNAATVLRALDAMWNVNLGAAGLVDAARSLGADVPYFLVGGPALGLGRGDDIHPLKARLRGRVLLAPGSGGVSTARVFQRYALLARKTRAASPIDRLVRSLDESRGALPHGVLQALRNDLDQAAVAESPTLASVARDVRRVARAEGAIQAAMSGSGSSFFLIFEDDAARKSAAARLAGLGIPTVACAFLSKRAYANRFEVKRARPKKRR